MTTVVNRKDTQDYDVYIGRGSIFGNDFTHLPPSCIKMEFRKTTVFCNSRKDAIAQHKEYFINRIKTDPEFKAQVLKLKDKRLGCFCVPLGCHGHTIADYLDGRLIIEEDFNVSL